MTSCSTRNHVCRICIRSSGLKLAHTCSGLVQSGTGGGGCGSAMGRAQGRGSCIGGGALASGGMGVLRLSVRQRRYYRQQALNGGHREAAGHGGGNHRCEAGGCQRDGAGDTGLEPDDTGPTETWRGGHAHQRQAQVVEGMRRINDPDRLARELGESERGSVLDAS